MVIQAESQAKIKERVYPTSTQLPTTKSLSLFLDSLLVEDGPYQRETQSSQQAPSLPLGKGAVAEHVPFNNVQSSPETDYEEYDKEQLHHDMY